MILCRYNSMDPRLAKDRWRLWFAWYPCWIYESTGTDIAWVWLCVIKRKWLYNERRWLRCSVDVDFSR